MTTGGLEQAIVEELRKILEVRALTQARAAVVLDVSPKHLSQVLRGHAHLSLSTLTEWSTRLGVAWTVEVIDLLE